ncbi:recombination protein NinB [Celeribacter naphthalenivorans]|uniref:recombination protein NinB n=1 Tax=Celeribacter naphthalenivorans TaxID=1614694 RepID=UPI001CF9607E|nr:recombination protein NinB [Celeribacter naphthalenivorans]
MAGQTIILRGRSQRQFAHTLLDKAPADAIVNIRKATRTVDQNAKMWAMLSDVSRARPEGRICTPETWKCLFMHALGHETRFELGLNGEPFPVGFRSSSLNKEQMSDLIEFIYAWGSERGVVWTEDAA